MTIRRATEKDMPRIHELLSQVEEVHHKIRPDLFKAGGRKYTDEELARIIADDNRPILVAVDENDALLGYAFCQFQQYQGNNIMTDIKTLYIDDLCVDETLRGRHIGRALYDAAVAYAKAHGCYNLTLNVWAGNETARRFYESCGLKPLKYGMEVVLDKS